MNHQKPLRTFEDQGYKHFILVVCQYWLKINRLASQLKSENGLRGLFFMDGIQQGMSIRETGLPVLIIQGAQDVRIPATGVRQLLKSSEIWEHTWN